jgi:hypothetical protein
MRTLAGMVRSPLPQRLLGLWIGVLLLGAIVGAVTVGPDRDVELIAGGGTVSAPAAPVVPRATTSSTTTPAPPTTAPAVVTTTTTVPARPVVTTATTAAPSTTTTAASGPRFTMTPTGALSASSGASFTLAGAGCTADRVVLRVHGGQLHGDMADYATVAPDGSWGIGFMVNPAGSYELRAECARADWSVVFRYAPVPFTILP